MQVGMIGMGKMGGNMAERLRRHGHTVIGYDHVPEVRQVESLDEMVDALQAPRVVWSMVPAGDPTEYTVTTMVDLLSPGDLIIEGGNSNFHDSQRRAAAAAERGIGFIDAGVSGGIWGLDEGYCIMAGGEVDDVARAMPLFDSLVTDDGFAHVGGPGAGHFAKMVHNGVEYGMMQALAEGYELLGASELVDVGSTLEVWRHGSVVRSWLLDLLAEAVRDDPSLSAVRGWAEDSGEGRWTVEEAIARAVPVPAITAALFARFGSRQEDSPAMRAIATLRNSFGGHGVPAARDLPG